MDNNLQLLLLDIAMLIFCALLRLEQLGNLHEVQPFAPSVLSLDWAFRSEYLVFNDYQSISCTVGRAWSQENLSETGNSIYRKFSFSIRVIWPSSSCFIHHVFAQSHAKNYLLVRFIVVLASIRFALTTICATYPLCPSGSIASMLLLHFSIWIQLFYRDLLFL